MFLKTTFLEGKKRYKELFSQSPPKLVLQFVERMICAPNGDFKAAGVKGSAVSYAWFLWQKGYKGETELDWLIQDYYFNNLTLISQKVKVLNIPFSYQV